MSRDRDPYGPPPPRRDSMSRRDDYASLRDDHYNPRDRYEILWFVFCRCLPSAHMWIKSQINSNCNCQTLKIFTNFRHDL